MSAIEESGSDVGDGAAAKVVYVPPVKGYVQATFTTGMVLEVIMHLHGTKDEFEMSDAVASFMGQMIASYPGDLPEGVA